MVFSHTYVFARVVFRTTLANDDVARDAVLTTKDLNA